ncbi:MAG: redoxin domain-containing protein [Acidobacteria bacterium]|nr:redoxin domain-containing protein [Acidobacteriota bacterium]
MSNRGRLLVISAVSLIALVLAVVFSTRFGADPRLSPSPLIGNPVPDVTLDLVESDDSLRLRDLAGQILVVNFWAPWCVPCRAEHSDLLALADGFEDLGVSVVGAVYQSRQDDVIAFLDELGRGYPVGMDDRSRVAIGFGVRGVPETYFVDRDGTVVAKITGPISLGLATATLDRIILGEPVESARTGEVQTQP